jgi:outer membrane protein TolC
VKKAFYTVLLAEESYNVLKKSYANAMNSLGSIKKQYERGLVAEYDFIRADVQARNVKPSVLQAENNLLMSYLTLKILLGIPADQNIKADGNLKQFSNDYEKFRPTSLELGNNSDLKQADLRMEKLRKQLSMTKLQRLPSLNLIGSYTFLAQNDNFNMFHYYWVPTSSVGLQMSIPILNGSTNRFKEKQIELGIEQMQLQKQYLSRNLNAQATNAITTMRQAYEQIESNAVGVKQAEKGYNIAQIRYNTGSGTLLELNDAEVALTQSKLNYNSAIYSYLKAKIDYEKTLGQE